MDRFDRLHEDIGAEERLDIMRSFAIRDIVSAPGHRALRQPAAVVEIASRFERAEQDALLGEPIHLGVFTGVHDGHVVLHAVECLDGHHRLLGALLATAWKTVGDVPAHALELRVNGRLARTGVCDPRWIPLEVAEASHLTTPGQYRDVSTHPLAKGDTAEISGETSSLDEVFPERDRGVPLGQLLAAWLDATSA